MTEQIVGRDPIEKTIVEQFVAAHPDESDEQISARIRRAATVMGDGDLPMSAETVARWRAEVSR